MVPVENEASPGPDLALQWLRSEVAIPRIHGFSKNSATEIFSNVELRLQQTGDLLFSKIKLN